MLSSKTKRLKSSFTLFVMEHKVLLVVISVSIVSFMFTMQLNSMYVLPSGTDPGLWIRYARALMGDMGSFWVWDPQANPLQYPPSTFVVLIGFIKLLGNEILAAKLLGSLAVALVPLSTFFVAKKILGDEIQATVACVFVAFFSAFFEMWSWGAYPNLLGLSLLSVVFYFVFAITSEPHKKDIIIATVASIVTVYTHHLTGIVLLGVLLLYTLFLVIRSFRMEKKSKLIKSIVVIISIIAITMICSLPLVIVGKETFVLSHTAALTFIIKADIIIFLFKSVWLLTCIVALAILYLISLVAKKAAAQDILLLLVWLSVPLLLTQIYIAGIYVDFNRFPFFSLQPLLILLAGSYRNFKVKTRFIETVLSVTLILLLISSSIYGIATAIGSSEYYHFMITGEVAPYSDQDIYDAILWIKDNTANNKSVLTSAYFGIWTRALANVKALFPEQLKFQFVKRYIEMNMDAETMLTSNYEARNAFFQVREGIKNHNFDSVVRVFYEGEYKDAIFLRDGDIGVELSNSSSGNYSIFLNSTSINSIEAANYGEFVRLTTIYTTTGVSINKTVELHKDSPEIKFFLHASSLDASDTKIAKIWMTFQTAEGGFQVADVEVREPEHVVLVNGESSTVRILFSSQSLADITLEKKRAWLISAFYNLTENNEQFSINTIVQSNSNEKAPIEMLNEGSVCLLSREDLLKKYNVEYIALMRFDLYLENIEADPRFELLPYENTKVKIFGVKQL